MSELSRIDADERYEREATRHDKLLQQKRFVAALRFATTPIEYFGLPDVDEAIAMADELIAKLEEPTVKPDEGTPYG